MAAMIHSPVLLRAQPQEDEDIALAHFIQTQGAWQKHHPSHTQQQQQQKQQQQPQSQPQSQPLPQPQQQQPLPYAYVAAKQPPRAAAQQHRSRPRTSINPHIQKSTSTPVSSMHRSSRKPQQAHSHSHQHQRPIDRRPKSMMPESRPPFVQPRPSSSSSATTASDSGRRSSITSVSSSVSQTVSVTSTASVSSKVSLSRRLRKVFSMNNLRSSRDIAALSAASSSTVSVNTVDSSSMQSIPEEGAPHKSPGFRRRSLASLSSLFLRNNASQTSITEEKNLTTAVPKPTPATSVSTPNRRPQQGGSQTSKNERKNPALRVDTDQDAASARKSILKTRTSTNGPDSPTSAVSARSPVHRTPPTTHRLAQSEGLPSPTPSSSSGSNRPRVASVTQQDDELAAPPAIGYHYGLPLHGSPKLKPASSSTSSLTDLRRKLQFSPTIQVHETFTSSDYDRRCDPNATCQRLSPMIAMKIKQELNEYKLTDMDVHVESRQYTHFFL